MKIEIYKRTNWLGRIRYRWRLLGNNNRIVLPQEAFNSLQALEHNLNVATRGLKENNRVFGEGFNLNAKDDPVSPGTDIPNRKKK